MNKDDLQNDLQDGLDPKLQQLYRQLPKEQPSAELDAKILAAAKMTTPKKPHHWQAPFALAASVVMVSSVALYLHEENPAAFKASVPTTQAPVAQREKPIAQNDADTIANTELLANEANKKTVTQKTKDAPIAKPAIAQTENAVVVKDNNLTAFDEKKVDIASHSDQISQTILAEKASKSVQFSTAAKEQEARQAKAETDQFAAAPAPAPMIAPAPQMQPQPEMTEQPSLKAGSLQAGRFQDSNRTNQQLSATSTELNKPEALEKSNSAPALAAAAPISLGVVAGSAIPMARPLEKQSAKRDEATARSDYTQNISVPVMSIEGVAMGMNREQLITQGLTCYVDVCHLDLNQPQQATYWGMPALNGHLTAYLSHHVVTKLVLQQKNAQLNLVKTALSNIGLVSKQSCIAEKGTLLIGRQLGTNIFNVRSMGVGLSLAICQNTKSH